MTCIVGGFNRNTLTAWIGGDSAGADSSYLSVRSDQKVFKKGQMLIGFTTSFRMGQLVRYALKVPTHPKGMGVEEYLATKFVDAARKCFEDGGYLHTKDGREWGGTFVVVYRGVAAEIHGDFQVAIPESGLAVVGSGSESARGALMALRAAGEEICSNSITLSLQISERNTSSVRGPFTVLSMPQKAEN